MAKKASPQRKTALPAKRETGSVAVLEGSEYAALQRNPREIAEIIETNVGPGGLNRFDLERIKMPTGGGTVWTLETLKGDRQVEELEGIILLKRTTRVYWKDSFEETGGNTPPDCSSDDGYVGRGAPGGECASCSFNEFGTAERNGKKGDGKACREILVLFVLFPGKLIPTVIAVTPGSLQATRKYFLRLAGEGYASYWVTTKFRLEKAANKRGIKYARISMQVGRALEENEIAAVRAYAENIKPALSQQVRLSQAEIEGQE